jgi:ribosomal-protein-alanine N-acetyltransferase
MKGAPCSISRADVRVRTDRFLVRTLKPDDVGPEYAAWFEDPVVQQFITWRPVGDPLVELRDFVADHFDRADSLLLGVFVGDGSHVANLKFEPINRERRTAVLGVLVGDSEWRGRRLFGEVFLAATELLKRQFGINRIMLGVDEENTAAVAAYSQIGFVAVSRPDDGSVWMEFVIQ